MRLVCILTLIFFLTGCAGKVVKPVSFDPPAKIPVGVKELINLPEIDGPVITIAIYGFGDKTGQRKPSTNFSQLSTAVTQGAENHVINALQKAGKGKWFKVLERVNLDNLVKERQLIRSTRKEFKEDNKMKPLLFAGLLIQGGVISYEANLKSGGAGARYLGVGNSKQYREDTITISLRLVSVSTGEVLTETLVSKSIISTSISQDIFRFIETGTELVEIEGGVSENESVSIALQKAIETGVLNIIKIGIERGYWEYE